MPSKVASLRWLTGAPADVLRAAERRGLLLPEEFYRLRPASARAQAFTASGLASLDQVQAIKDSLDAALAAGLDFRAWQREVLARGVDGGLPAHRLEMIFRTNLQVNYAAGRAAAILSNVDTHPFLLYSAVRDARTRPSHARLDGLVLPVLHPFWKTHFPPWAFNCRCAVVAITEAEARRRIDRARQDGRTIDAVPADVAMPDEGWNYDRLNGPALQGLEESVAARRRLCVPRLFARDRVEPPLWCDGPGATTLAVAANALSYADPPPTPRRLAADLRLAEGRPAAEYLAVFLRDLGATAGEASLLLDAVAGQRVAIDASLFEKQSGASKLTKRGRQVYLRYLALGIKEPDEVWYVRDEAGKEYLYFLAQFEAGKDRPTGVQAVFRWGGSVWEPVTGYQSESSRYLADQREWLTQGGVLIYRR